MQGFEEKQREDLLDLLAELSLVEGNGTSLITMYVPSTMSQHDKARNLLRDEMGLAKNIKDTSVSSAVQVLLLFIF